MSDDVGELSGGIRATGVGRRVFVTATSESTNDDARARLAADGPTATHGCVFTTRHQTLGRGTRGRKWWSPPDAGLALSIVLAPDPPLPHPPAVTLVTALAVCDAAAALGAGVAIRWPNDVVDREGRKLAGILAEAVASVPPATIVGIGINVRPSREPPPDLARPAGDLATAGARDAGRATFARELFAALDRRLAEFQSRGVAGVAAEFGSRSFLRGRPVVLRHGLRTLRGTFDVLDEGFRVHLLESDGTRLALPSEQLELVDFA